MLSAAAWPMTRKMKAGQLLLLLAIVVAGSMLIEARGAGDGQLFPKSQVEK